MRRFLFASSLLFLVSTICAGQELPRFEVFGGYSYLRRPEVLDQNAHGWEAALAYNVNNWLSLKADFSGNYDSASGALFSRSLREHHYLFGPQLSWRTRHATLFTHGMIGATHLGVDSSGVFVAHQSSTVNEFAFAAGGGADLNLNRHISWRVFQIDYLRTNFIVPENDLRVSTGLVFRFGSR
jgi:opacity protein-like surface antigen